MKISPYQFIVFTQHNESYANSVRYMHFLFFFAASFNQQALDGNLQTNLNHSFKTLLIVNSLAYRKTLLVLLKNWQVCSFCQHLVGSL